jgi:hypothetical protein
MAKTWDEVIEMVKRDDENKWDVQVPIKSFWMNNDGKLQGKFGDREQLGVTDWAMGQMCGKLGIPKRYIQRLPTNLQAVLVNHDLDDIKEDKNYLFRCKGDTARAFLSEKYSPVDNRELVEIVAEMCGGLPNHQIRKFHYSERGFFSKVLLNDLRKWDPANRSKEMLFGFMIGNSEVGSRTVSVEPFVYREACTNDMVVQQDSVLHQRHVHLTQSEIKVRVIKAVNSTLRLGAATLDKFIETHQEKVENPADVIREIAARHKFSEKRKDELVLAYEAEPIDTKFGVVNAFTRYARERLNDEDRVEMERFAGKLLSRKLPQVKLASEVEARPEL